jgi:predicted enzyme related to lactoylglutathione lyase
MASKIIWYEVLGKDGPKLRGFFGELFGWSFKNEEGKDYGTTAPDATGVPGGVGSQPSGSSWALFYVSVPDVKASLEKAQRLGAKVLMPVTKLPDVTIAVFADPEGHPVGIAQLPA